MICLLMWLLQIDAVADAHLVDGEDMIDGSLLRMEQQLAYTPSWPLSHCVGEGVCPDLGDNHTAPGTDAHNNDPLLAAVLSWIDMVA